MTLAVTPASAAPQTFTWTEQVQLVGDAQSDGLSYQYAGDAVPLLVNARTAASPVCLFDAPDGFFFAPGTYTFTLSANRIVASAPLQATFSVRCPRTTSHSWTNPARAGSWPSRSGSRARRCC